MKNLIFATVTMASLLATVVVADTDVCEFAQEIMIQNAKTAGSLEFQIENRIIMEPSETMKGLRNTLAETESSILSLKKSMTHYCGN